MNAARDFLGLCAARGVNSITGTSCSELKRLIKAIDDPSFSATPSTIAATSEPAIVKNEERTPEVAGFPAVAKPIGVEELLNAIEANLSSRSLQCNRGMMIGHRWAMQVRFNNLCQPRLAKMPLTVVN